MAQITPSKKLYDLLISKNFDLKATDSRTGRTPVNDQGQPDISEADQFSFDFVADSGRNYGTVVVLLGNDNNLTMFFGDNVGKTMEGQDKSDWFDFLYQMKQFATKNFLTFSPENINKLAATKQGQAAISEGLFESWQGKGNISWNGAATEARILIKHKKALGEGEARFRYIDSIFVETADGERYKMKSRSLTAAKAMLEHVRHGGNPYDARGQHINAIVEELSVLSRFRRASSGQVFEGDTKSLVEQTDQYYKNMHSVLKHMGNRRGYQSYFESWTPGDVNEGNIVIEDLKNLFVKQTIDHRIEEALPILARITQEASAMKETKIFESWINNLVEGTWAIPETPEARQKLVDLLSKDFPVGPDATNATEQLYDVLGDDVLFDQLQDLADADANADARSVILARMQEMSNLSPDIQSILDQMQMDDPAPDAEPELDQMAQDVEGDEQLPQNVEEAGMFGPSGIVDVIRQLVNKPKAIGSSGQLGAAERDARQAAAAAAAKKLEKQGYRSTIPEQRDTEEVDEDLSRRGFLRGLGAAAVGAAGLGAANAMAGSNDPGYARKVQEKHFEMMEKNPRYAKEHADLKIAIVRGMTGQSAENNKRWTEKTAQLLQKYGVKVNESAEEGQCNMTEAGEYCPEHGLEECGIYEYTGNPTNFGLEESDELTQLKRLALGK